jgi:hypothetical protein
MPSDALSVAFVEDGGRKAVKNLVAKKTKCGCIPGSMAAAFEGIFHTCRIILSYPLILIFWENDLFEGAFGADTALLVLNMIFYYVPIGLLVQFGIEQSSMAAEYDQKAQNMAMWGCIVYVHLPVIYSIMRGLRLSRSPNTIPSSTFCERPSFRLRMNHSNLSAYGGIMFEFLQHSWFCLPAKFLSENYGSTKTVELNFFAEDLTLPGQDKRHQVYLVIALVAFNSLVLIMRVSLVGQSLYKLIESRKIWLMAYFISGPLYVSILVALVRTLDCTLELTPTELRTSGADAHATEMMKLDKPVLRWEPQLTCWEDKHLPMGCAAFICLFWYITQVTILPSGTFKETMRSTIHDIYFVPLYLKCHFLLKGIFAVIYATVPLKYETQRILALTVINLCCLLLNIYMNPCPVWNVNRLRNFVFGTAAWVGICSLFSIYVVERWGKKQARAEDSDEYEHNLLGTFAAGGIFMHLVYHIISFWAFKVSRQERVVSALRVLEHQIDKRREAAVQRAMPKLNKEQKKNVAAAAKAKEEEKMDTQWHNPLDFFRNRNNASQTIQRQVRRSQAVHQSRNAESAFAKVANLMQREPRERDSSPRSLEPLVSLTRGMMHMWVDIKKRTAMELRYKMQDGARKHFRKTFTTAKRKYKKDVGFVREHVLPLLPTLLQHPSRRVQFQTAWAIGNMALCGTSNRRGGMHPRYHLNRLHCTVLLFNIVDEQESSMLRKKALQALVNMLIEPCAVETLLRVHPDYCIPRLVLLMRDSIECAPFCCQALRNIARVKRFIPRIADAGAISVMATLGLSSQTMPFTKEKALFGLAVLALDSSPGAVSHRNIYSSAGVAQRLVLACKNQCEAVAVAAITLLANLSCHQTLASTFIGCGTLHYLTSLRYSSDIRVATKSQIAVDNLIHWQLNFAFGHRIARIHEVGVGLVAAAAHQPVVRGAESGNKVVKPKVGRVKLGKKVGARHDSIMPVVGESLTSTKVQGVKTQVTLGMRQVKNMLLGNGEDDADWVDDTINNLEEEHENPMFPEDEKAVAKESGNLLKALTPPMATVRWQNLASPLDSLQHMRVDQSTFNRMFVCTQSERPVDINPFKMITSEEKAKELVKSKPKNGTLEFIAMPYVSSRESDVPRKKSSKNKNRKVSKKGTRQRAGTNASEDTKVLYRYTPKPGFKGQDNFSFCLGTKSSEVVRVMITVINNAGSNAQASNGLAHFDYDGREVVQAPEAHATAVSRGNSGKTLSIMVLEGWGFAQATQQNKPHVVLKLGKEARKTSAVPNCSGQPLWMQMFNFKVPPSSAADKDQRLQVSFSAVCEL